MRVMIITCTVVLKLCSKELLRFHKVVSERARQRDTHSYMPLPPFLGLARLVKAKINGALSNEAQGGRRERGIPFDIIIHEICTGRLHFSSLEDLSAKYLFHLRL